MSTNFNNFTRKDWYRYILENYFDETTLADSYAEFLQSKNRAFSDVLTVLLNAATNPELTSVEAVTQYLIDNGFSTDSILSTSSGHICRIVDLSEPIALVNSGDAESSDPNVVLISSADGTTVNYSLDNLFSDFGEQLNSTKILTIALDTISKSDNVSLDSSNFYARIASEFTNATDTVLSTANYYYNILSQKGISLAQKTSACMQNVLESVQSIESSTSVLSFASTSSEYTGASPVASWITGLDLDIDWSRPLETIFGIITAGFKVVGNVLRGVGEWFAGLWRKYIKPLYNPNDFKINEDFDADCIDIPARQFKVPISSLDNAPRGMTFASYGNALLSVPYDYDDINWTVDGIVSEIPSNSAFQVTTKFGIFRFWKNSSDNTIDIQIFITPGSYPQGRPSFVLSNLIDHYRDLGKTYVGVDQTYGNINNILKTVFATELSVNNDLSNEDAAYTSIQWAMARCWAFIALMFSMSVSDFDESYLNTNLYLHENTPWYIINMLGLIGASITVNTSATSSEYSSFYMNGFDGAKSSSTANSLVAQPVSDTITNRSFVNLITGGNTPGLAIYLLSENSSYSYENLAGFIITSLLYPLILNGYEGQKRLFLANLSAADNTTFVPYTKNSGNLTAFHYNIATDEQNATYVGNFLTVALTAAAVVAIGAVAIKAFLTIKRTLNARYILSRTAIARVATFAPGSEEWNNSYKDAVLYTKSYNRYKTWAAVLGIGTGSLSVPDFGDDSSTQLCEQIYSTIVGHN